MTADYRQNPTPETNVPVVFSKPVLPLLPSFSPCLQHGYDFPRRGDFTAKEYVMSLEFNTIFDTYQVFNSILDIYPDKVHKGAVVGYRKADGTPLEFPCALDTSNAIKDAKGRWIASRLGLKPVVAKHSGTLERTKAVEAWIGDRFGKKMKAKAFWNNLTLEHVRFVDGVTSIGDFEFSDYIGLTSVTIPSSVTAIGYKAFAYCTGLTSITIPSSVTSIGDYAFIDCSRLTDVYVDQPQSALLDNAGLPAGCTVHWNQAEAV